MLFFGFELRKLKKSCILQEENSWLWELGVMEIVQESAALLWEGVFRWAFIWLLCLDASRIQVILISGIQVEKSFGVESSLILIIHSEGAHTQGISALGFCRWHLKEFLPFLFCVLSWREVKCSRETAAAKLKSRVLSSMQVCSESSVFMYHRPFPAFTQCYKIREDKFIAGAIVRTYLPVYC